MSKIEKIKPSGIFTNYVFKAIPLAFDESLSYYEMLCGILDLLKTQEEVINNNADLLAELEEYVIHYFDNLDIQEEVNNKLDEMAEDGTLENLISQYIYLATTYVYDNVTKMKQATNLINGSYVRTSGFYNNDDQGGAFYKVRSLTSEDTIDEKTIIALNDITLVAELLKQDVMNVREFGAKGDGETDDTLAIQTALNYNSNIIIKDGTYMIDAEDGVAPVSNSNIKLVNATLKAITNNLTNYKVIYINDVDNVIIEGGTIEGDRSTHTGETGEWGHCIHIADSNNITLKNMILKNAWGDGLYVNGGSNIETYNMVVDNCRRNGYSIITIDGFKSNNDLIKNTNGTDPEAAVDIEPNNADEILKNIVFNNLKTYNNTGNGMQIYLINNTNANTIDININNHYDYGSYRGLYINKNENVGGNINIINSHYEHNNRHGIRIRNFLYSSCVLYIKNPYILNCNQDGQTGTVNGSSIVIEGDDTSHETGNIIIENPYITNATSGSNIASIYGYGYDDTYRLKDLKIINPLNRDKDIFVVRAINFDFIDSYRKYIVTYNGNQNIGGSNVNSMISNELYTTNRVKTITSGYPIGAEITCRNINTSGYRMTVALADCYLLQYSNNVSPQFYLANYGESVTLKKIDATHWIITNIVGTII